MKRFREKPPTSQPKSTERIEAETALFAAELGDVPSIDLHGESSDDAIRALDAFVNHEFVAGTEGIKIIHGRGSGKLREAIHSYLQRETTLVAAFRDSHAPGQTGGVTLAILHRR